MIKVKNAGIKEAIGAIREMSLRKNLRYLYEEHMKSIRDRRAEDAYVREEGMAEGRAEGRAVGKAEDILQILTELDDIPEDLSRRIMAEKDLDVLAGWLKTAVRAKDIQEFREECGI